MRRLASLLILTLWLPAMAASAAQPPRPGSSADEAAVRAADARYWQTFNSCDLAAMAPLVTADVEFYHDKGGLTTTRQGVIDSFRKGPCADPGMKLRREAVPGSVQFHPMAGGFALITGSHRFYVTRRGEPEHLDGEASFAALWQFDHGSWRMRRILSYDHHPG